MTFNTSAVASLLLQRFFGEIARLRLHFVEQAHILDCDDGLVGERSSRVRFGAN